MTLTVSLPVVVAMCLTVILSIFVYRKNWR